MDVKMWVVYISCIMGIFLFGKIFIVPIKAILKLVINSILGILLLYIVNLIGELWNFHIGINVFTAIIVGILGIPGIILLTILRIFIV